MAYLTSRNYNTCSLNDIFHIVKTGDTSQGNPAGSSYKTNLYQILDNSNNCFQNLYVKNIHGCPTNLYVQPLDEGNVYFGSNNASRGVTIDLPTYGGTDRVKVGINKSAPAYTVDGYSYDGRQRWFWYDDLVPVGGSHYADVQYFAISGQIGRAHV